MVPSINSNALFDRDGKHCLIPGRLIPNTNSGIRMVSPVTVKSMRFPRRETSLSSLSQPVTRRKRVISIRSRNNAAEEDGRGGRGGGGGEEPRHSRGIRSVNYTREYSCSAAASCWQSPSITAVVTRTFPSSPLGTLTALWD